MDSYIDHYGDKELINRAYLVYVALDENEKPSPVPEFVPANEEEEEEYAAAVERKIMRMASGDK